MFNVSILEYYKLHQIPDVNFGVIQNLEDIEEDTPIGEAHHGYNVIMAKVYGMNVHLTDQMIKENVIFDYMKRTAFSLDYAVRRGSLSINLSSEFMNFDKYEDSEADILSMMFDDGIMSEYEAAKTIPMFAGAGNDGNDPFDHDEAKAASRLAWIGVGAVNPDLVPRGYSSWGNGHVDICGIDGVVNGTLGTSFAVAYVSGMCDGYRIRHFLEFGYLPDKTQTLAWMYKHTKDLLESGKDLKTGHGVLLPPKRIEFFETVYDLKTKEEWINHFVNGQMHTYATDKKIHKNICKPEVITEYFDTQKRQWHYSHVI